MFALGWTAVADVLRLLVSLPTVWINCLAHASGHISLLYCAAILPRERCTSSSSVETAWRTRSFKKSLAELDFGGAINIYIYI